jgi:hypothetical protein
MRRVVGLAQRYLANLSLYFSKTIENTKVVQMPLKSASQTIYVRM